MPPSVDKSADDGQEEVYIKNPTYEGRSHKQATDETTYETVSERSGQLLQCTRDDREGTYDKVVHLGPETLLESDAMYAVPDQDNDATYAVPDQDKHWQGEGTHIR